MKIQVSFGEGEKSLPLLLVLWAVLVIKLTQSKTKKGKIIIHMGAHRNMRLKEMIKEGVFILFFFWGGGHTICKGLTRQRDLESAKLESQVVN